MITIDSLAGMLGDTLGGFAAGALGLALKKQNPGCNCCEETTHVCIRCTTSAVTNSVQINLQNIGNNLCATCSGFNGTYMATLVGPTTNGFCNWQFQTTVNSPTACALTSVVFDLLASFIQVTVQYYNNAAPTPTIVSRRFRSNYTTHGFSTGPPISCTTFNLTLFPSTVMFGEDNSFCSYASTACRAIVTTT